MTHERKAKPDATVTQRPRYTPLDRYAFATNKRGDAKRAPKQTYAHDATDPCTNGEAPKASNR